MSEQPRRRWVLSPLRAVEPRGADGGRATTATDDAALADLLAAAYGTGEVDHDPAADHDADHAAEIRTWRRVDQADDAASRIATADEEVVGASLIARELGAPFLYEVVTLPAHRRRGLARSLVTSSLHELARRAEPAITAWVTVGNAASERLLDGLGFRPTTPPLLGEQALALYRAATAAAAHAGVGFRGAAAESTPTPGTARVWVVTEAPFDAYDVRVRGTDVEVHGITPGDALPELIARTTPVAGYSFLASIR